MSQLVSGIIFKIQIQTVKEHHALDAHITVAAIVPRNDFDGERVRVDRVMINQPQGMLRAMKASLRLCSER